MANYTGQVSVAASTTVGLFDTIGIDPIHCAVALHSDTGSPPLVLVDDAAGDHPSGFALPDAEGTTFQFVTDKDEVYVKNISGSAIILSWYVSAAA